MTRRQWLLVEARFWERVARGGHLSRGLCVAVLMGAPIPIYAAAMARLWEMFRPSRSRIYWWGHSEAADGQRVLACGFLAAMCRYEAARCR